MNGLGTIVNVVSILAGGTIGLLLKKILSRRFTDTITQGLGLAVVVIGLSGTLGAMFSVTGDGLSSQYTLLMILSLAIGALAGELIGIEARLDSFAKLCENKFAKLGGAASFSQGFVTASLVYCVGAMAVVGALEDGINGNAGILFAKSALDGITAMVFSSAMGMGVLFSVIAVGIYQGIITALSVFIAPYLAAEVVAQMSLVGSILIIGVGFNMLKITKIKVGNLLPAIFVPAGYYVLRRFA